MNRDIRLDRGYFILSLDFELIWGTLDLFGPDRFRKACETERALIDRLLVLFEKYRIPATWCILGHLLLDQCNTEGGRKHPEIVRPNHAWCRHDWFERDPCTNESAAPVFYGRSLVDKIQGCAVPQEIGCHTFSHVIFSNPGCSAATAQSEIAACTKLASERGITMTSFAFPRNRVGHLEVLNQHGFRCYRGPEPFWYESENCPELVRRLARLWEVLSVRTPPTVLPVRTESGLWNIPGSMIYFPMHGFRRHIPLGWRVRRAIKGLTKAVNEKRIFHLWFHPTNLADEPDAMFQGLEAILKEADLLRQRDQLAIVSMGEMAEFAESLHASPETPISVA